MKKKIVCILVFIMLVFTATLSVADTISKSNFIEPRVNVTIYVNTTAIDNRDDLNDTQKTALKNKILQHLRNNYEDAVGADNVTITNDPSQAATANRTVQIDPGSGNPPNRAWGSWTTGSNVTRVFLGVFMNYSLVNGSFKNADGTWNITALANAIGHTSGHEVGHSYSIGHNFETNTSGPGGTENRSKMTVGTNIGFDERANASFLFDNHSKDVMRRNWGRRPCNSAPDYDQLVLISHYWDEPYSPYLPDEFGTVDAIFSCYVEIPGWYELGFLGTDTDNGIYDGDPDFDFIYKSSLRMDEIDAKYLSFLLGNHKHTSWLLRGTEDSPYPGDWFHLNSDNVALEGYIENPVGDLVARYVNMNWPEQGVYITLDSYAHGDESCPYNGFTYELLQLNPPGAPEINGPAKGAAGTSYDYTFFSEDPDGNEVYYYVDWGDGETTGWLGPYPAGDMLTLDHTWDKQDTYTIKAKAKDTYDLESDWSELDVTMPRNRAINTPFLDFIQQHPMIFQLLQRFLKL